MLYSATDPSTPFGEVFQDSWVIDLHEDGRHLSGWRPTRGLMLLDLIDTWPLRNGATYDLSTSERHVCRRWAQAIHDQLSVTGPGIDGLWAPSTMTGRAIVVLFGRAADSFPSAPDLSRPLHHDDLVAVVEQARLDTGYDVVG